MSPERSRRPAVRRARWTAAAAAVVTGSSVAAGFGQMPDLIQWVLLLLAVVLGGWLAWQDAVPGGSASKKSISVPSN